MKQRSSRGPLGRASFALVGLAGLAVGLAGPPAGGVTAEQQAILDRMRLVNVSDGMGGTVETIRITGVNVQIVNGLGATNGIPANPYGFASQSNGAGNLIVGYNERVLNDPRPRTGSHNVVVGPGHEFSGIGGLLVGWRHRARGIYPVVFGEESQSLFRFNTVLGGGYNVASGTNGTVCGGTSNEAGFNFSTVLGGNQNVTGGFASCIAGGRDNDTVGLYATVSGGRGNTASGQDAAVSGGANRAATGTNDWVAGSLFEDQ